MKASQCVSEIQKLIGIHGDSEIGIESDEYGHTNEIKCIALGRPKNGDDQSLGDQFFKIYFEDNLPFFLKE